MKSGRTAWIAAGAISLLALVGTPAVAGDDCGRRPSHRERERPRRGITIVWPKIPHYGGHRDRYEKPRHKEPEPVTVCREVCLDGKHFDAHVTLWRECGALHAKVKLIADGCELPEIEGVRLRIRSGNESWRPTLCERSRSDHSISYSASEGPRFDACHVRIDLTIEGCHDSASVKWASVGLE